MRITEAFVAEILERDYPEESYTKLYRIRFDLASLNNRQNPGNADRMGVSGVDLCCLALKGL